MEVDKTASTGPEMAPDQSDLAAPPDQRSENTSRDIKSEIAIHDLIKESNENNDEELEEGELKDDDDDDDDDGDIEKEELRNLNKNPKQNTDDKGSDDNASVKSDKSKSSKQSKSSEASKTSHKSGDNDSGGSSKRRSRSKSVSSSSSSSIAISRDGSSSKQSKVRSHPSRARRFSPNQHSRLVSMRAKLLEARSREIEMKFQKNRSNTASSPSISIISSAGSAAAKLTNLKTTIAKPTITYAENPRPTSVEPLSPSFVKAKKGKKRPTSSRNEKEKRKRIKTPDSPKKSSAPASKDEDPIETPPNLDRQGPRTPPDNQVLNLDNEHIEWPSYLIKMTVAQPSISYSVNPASVMEPTQPTPSNDTADLNSDYYWYYNYFLGMEMSKAQAHHQACSVVISSGDYDEQRLDRFLEQRGFIRQSTSPKLDNENADKSINSTQGLHFRDIEPVVTVLKLNREITLPNGKTLPRGTIQKIVHPFPRTDRVAPDIRTPSFDL